MTGSQIDKSVLIIGTYTDSLPHVRARGRGIHLLGFDSSTGMISDGPVGSDLKNPTYLTVSRDGARLYAVRELDEDQGASLDTFALDAATPALTKLSSVAALGGCPCHVALDAGEKRLFVSNYATGSFVAFALDAEGLPQPNPLKIQREGSSLNPERQQGPHVHFGAPTPDGENVLVCDAGADEIVRHRFEGTTIAPNPDLVLKSDPGSLPRHLAFLPDGGGFLVIHELAAKIDAYRYAAEGAQRVTGAKGAAAIHAHPNGRFVYASNRGHDSIFGVDVSAGLDALKPIGWWSTHGATPRDFAIDPSGRFLVAANQDSHNLTVHAIDAETGELSLMSSGHEIGSPVCLVFVPRP
jgi:6-phosphogluconolactonase